MGSEWNKYRLQDLDIKFEDGDRSSKYPKATEFLSVGNHPFINTKNLSDGQLDLTEVNFISNIKFDEIKKGRVNPDDILISTRGSKLGKVAFYRDHKWKQPLINAQLLILRSNDERLDPEFLYFLLNSNKGQAQIEMLKSGSAQPQLPVRDLKKFEIYVPNVVIQKQIVKLGRILDKKIALNRQINQTLEQMAQTLFKSWFVDFDPVIDNALDAIANGQNIEIPESLAKRFEARKAVRESEGFEPLPADIRQLFPCEFEESELGFVPKGWGVKDITELVDTVSVTYPLKTVDKVIFLNTGDIENGKFLHANYSSSVGLPGQAKKSIQKNDILFSEIRPQNKRFAFVNFKADEYVVSTKLMVLRAKNGIDSLLPYFILSLDKTIRDLQRIAELRSGTFPQITYKELGLISLVLPNEKQLIDVFVNQYLHPIYNRKFGFLNENEELIKLRDTLLPKLISGELRLDSPQGEALQQAVSAE